MPTPSTSGDVIFSSRVSSKKNTQAFIPKFFGSTDQYHQNKSALTAPFVGEEFELQKYY